MAVMSRPLIGWQTLLADLSLILFMVTAAAQADSVPKKRATSAAGAAKPSQQGEALAVYRAGGHAPKLADWLKAQGQDPRQMLTIVATYADAGEEMAALAAAADLATQAAGVGRPARLIIEPGERADT
ncbi:MAG: hypothetical protein RLY97_581, partial [Pseudomonadota bacterium]